MHAVSYELFIKPKESAGCHQTLSHGWSLGRRLLLRDKVRCLGMRLHVHQDHCTQVTHVTSIKICHLLD